MGGRETEGRREGLAASPPAGRTPISQHPGKPEAKGKRLEKLQRCLSPYNCERRHLAQANLAPPTGCSATPGTPGWYVLPEARWACGAAALPLGALPHTQEPRFPDPPLPHQTGLHWPLETLPTQLLLAPTVPNLVALHGGVTPTRIHLQHHHLHMFPLAPVVSRRATPSHPKST